MIKHWRQKKVFVRWPKKAMFKGESSSHELKYYIWPIWIFMDGHIFIHIDNLCSLMHGIKVRYLTDPV